MALKVAVWGTGNVGRPAIRAILSHADLELAGVIVANPNKVGLDAGEIVGLPSTGVLATDDWQSVLDARPDALVYTANADIRPEEAHADLMACLSAGVNVVSSAFYAYLDPNSTPPEALEAVNTLCTKTGASLLVSGVDPGWMMDMMPAIVSGMSSNIREIRMREIFNYALYDQPQVVREVIGFGGPMDATPPMLFEMGLEMIWGPMVRLVGNALGQPVEDVNVVIRRKPLERTIEVPGMGTFEKGTMGAFWFEVQGMVGGEPRFIVEHVTRIDDECAPDWPYPAEGGGCHQVYIGGDPDLHLSVHCTDHYDPGPAAGGNASAACWLVNALPGVCAADPGVVTAFDIPRFEGRSQMASSAKA